MEGMEDEDMKKETQNLAYPPAFKLGRFEFFEQICHDLIWMVNNSLLQPICQSCNINKKGRKIGVVKELA